MSKEKFTKDETINAIESFLEWGEQELGKTQQGYFSGDGWAARCLRAHLKDLEAPKGLFVALRLYGRRRATAQDRREQK